ncbi:hypothetical protein [Streptomyces sp. NPDC002851]
MHTARSTLQYARQIATLLGPAWTADSCGRADLAALHGPSLGLEVTTTAPVRASTPVTVTLSLPGSLVWPRRSDPCPKVTRTVGNPQALADAIRTAGLPSWKTLRAELDRRTERTRHNLEAYMAKARRLAGPEAQVSYGSRPGVADLRWPGGRAIIHADDEGSARIRHLVLTELPTSAFGDVLRAVGPAEDRSSSAVPPIGLTF